MLRLVLIISNMLQPDDKAAINLNSLLITLKHAQIETLLLRFDSVTQPDFTSFLPASVQKKNILPTECLVISDSMQVLELAARAGMAPLGYEPVASHNDHLYGIDYIVQDLSATEASYLVQVYKRFHHEPLTILETERLLLRELTLEDIPALHRICSNPEVQTYLTEPVEDLPTELEKHRAYIKNVYEFTGFGYWGVFLRDTNTLIGRCGIQNNTIDGNPEIELGYLLDPAFQGKGYARECVTAVLRFALQELQLSRICALIDVRNTRSLSLAAAAGMHCEKTVQYRNRTCSLYVLL